MNEIWVDIILYSSESYATRFLTWLTHWRMLSASWWLL